MLLWQLALSFLSADHSGNASRVPRSARRLGDVCLVHVSFAILLCFIVFTCWHDFTIILTFNADSFYTDVANIVSLWAWWVSVSRISATLEFNSVMLRNLAFRLFAGTWRHVYVVEICLLWIWWKLELVCLRVQLVASCLLFRTIMKLADCICHMFGYPFQSIFNYL